MKTFFGGQKLGEIPSDADDVGQSAYVGWLIVQAVDKHREGTPFKEGDSVSIREGIKFKYGRYIVRSDDFGIRKIEEVSFSSKLEPDGNGGLKVIGWVAKLIGIPFLIKCDSMRTC